MKMERAYEQSPEEGGEGDSEDRDEPGYGEEDLFGESKEVMGPHRYHRNDSTLSIRENGVGSTGGDRSDGKESFAHDVDLVSVSARPETEHDDAKERVKDADEDERH